MDFDQVGKAGSMLGSAGVVVIDDQTCMVEFALRTISFYQHESCGWCIPCREGTDWLKKSLTRFHAGFGESKDIDNIQYLAENMMGRTFCPLGDAAAMPTIAFVKKFRKEFEDHLNGKPCPFAKHVEWQSFKGRWRRMADVTFTVDGKILTAPAGTLLIDACRKAGIEIPAFCYYPGLSLQAACRMCVVRQEKVGKLQTACTTTVAEGQVFITESAEIAQARKATIQLLLGNHPLDCPVCDAGGECELQDMTFKYGAGESLYAEAKQHREEQQWSPAVYFDRPRCILCYRCVRMCGEGMDVWALGVQNRGVTSVIAPNGGDQLDCEQCGMCIDVCPVGALTSGSYRYKTRPWEMNHVSTVCTHCADGCKVTLGVRQSNDGSEIVRADNRDKSGINGDFLCAKGRFGFDFVESPERLTSPLVRNAEGKLEPATWEHALRFAASKLKEIRDSKGGEAIGVIGSNHTTNEENYLLQKFARTVLGRITSTTSALRITRTLPAPLPGHPGKNASLRDIGSPARFSWWVAIRQKNIRFWPGRCAPMSG